MQLQARTLELVAFEHGGGASSVPKVVWPVIGHQLDRPVSFTPRFSEVVTPGVIARSRFHGFRNKTVETVSNVREP